MKRQPMTEETAERIISLGPHHDTDEIAVACGVSTNAVTRLLLQEGIKPRRRDLAWKEPKPHAAPDETTRPYDPREVRETRLATLLRDRRPNPMEVARCAWEHRLTCDGPCLKVNGRPLTFDELMRRTNVLLRGSGLPQLTANPAWTK